MLVDVSGRKLDTTIYGKEHKMPIGIAPTGAAGMMWYRGELELARAAKAAGIPYSLATGSITSMEQVARRSRWHAVDAALHVGRPQTVASVGAPCLGSRF